LIVHRATITFTVQLRLKKGLSERGAEKLAELLTRAMKASKYGEHITVTHHVRRWMEEGK
jgi:alpha-D-ribose 1-methylphosphonate 5-triphosphate synthase subunit PhnI